MSVNCATAAIAIIMAASLRIVLSRLNKRLDRGEYVEGAVNRAPREAAEKGFRFLV
jgi:hypothetical protein